MNEKYIKIRHDAETDVTIHSEHMVVDNTYVYKNWGKADKFSVNYHLLEYHCLDTAAVCNVILNNDVVLMNKFEKIMGLDKEVVRSLLLFLVSCHDIGKFSERFQNLRKDLLFELRGHTSNREYKVKHDSMGFHIWHKIRSNIFNGIIQFPDDNDLYDWFELFDILIKPVTGHHGEPPKYNDSSDLFTNEDIQLVKFYVQMLIKMFKPDFEKLYENGFDYPILKERFNTCSWLLAGFTVLCDWIGSNSNYFDLISSGMSLEDYWNKYALPSAELAVHAAGILPVKASTKSGMSELYSKFDKPTSLQQYVSDFEISKSPHLVIIEDTTGSGKTEAGIVLGHRFMVADLATGIYFALPTMATSNAMYKRISKIYNKLFDSNINPSLMLTHSHSRLSDEFIKSVGFKQITENDVDNSTFAQCNQWIADSNKKALLAHVGVGTIDQLLMSMLPTYHQSLRVYGAAKNVLIIDEVHAYDEYMSTILCRVLELHAMLGGSVILLSATLPKKLKQKLVDSYCKGLKKPTKILKDMSYPLITVVNNNGICDHKLNIKEELKRTVKLEFFHNENDIITKLIEISNSGKCACWIRNTVDDAIEAYDKLIQLIESDNIDLLHSRFIVEDRKIVEERVIKSFNIESINKRCGRIVISTQILEQSLDLDFDYIVSDLAPIELLIQRIGRLQRHSELGKDRVPVFGIFTPDITDTPSKSWYRSFFTKAAFVYPDHGKLWLTAKTLNKQGKIEVPKDFRPLIESIYADDAVIPESLRNITDKAIGESRAKVDIGYINSLDPKKGYLRDTAKWLSNASTPTRLGEVEVTLRLAQWNGNTLSPFSDDCQHPWEYSDVRVAMHKVSKILIENQKLQLAIDSAKLTMSDKGKWCILVPMTLNKNEWSAVALDSKNNVVYLTYNRLKGLIINKQYSANR